MTDGQLDTDAFGQLVWIAADGSRHAGVTPVRAFPLAAPDEGIALIGSDGHELTWIPHLGAVAEPAQGLIRAALAKREFVPEITRIVAVTSFATPTTWTVVTDRGDTQFILKSEDDLRRLADDGVLVADNHGIQYRIRSLSALDAASRRLLDRFL